MEIVQLVASRLKSDTLKNYNHKIRQQSCKALRISVITEIHFTNKHVRHNVILILPNQKIYNYVYIDINKKWVFFLLKILRCYSLCKIG